MIIVAIEKDGRAEVVTKYPTDREYIEVQDLPLKYDNYTTEPTMYASKYPVNIWWVYPPPELPAEYKMLLQANEVSQLVFVALAQSQDEAAPIFDAVTLAEHSALFVEWYEHEWKAGSIVIDPDNGMLYKATANIGAGQKHYKPNTFLSAGGWKAISNPAEEYPEWSEAIGHLDGYMIGDKITYKSKRYISKINNNVWTPDEYAAGWNEVT